MEPVPGNRLPFWREIPSQRYCDIPFKKWNVALWKKREMLNPYLSNNGLKLPRGYEQVAMGWGWPQMVSAKLMGVGEAEVVLVWSPQGICEVLCTPYTREQEGRGHHASLSHLCQAKVYSKTKAKNTSTRYTSASEQLASPCSLLSACFVPLPISWGFFPEL